MIPINLAFFYRDSAAGKVMAMYPSPAGAIESLLSLESWAEIAGSTLLRRRWNRMSRPSWSTGLARRHSTTSHLSMSATGWSV